MAGSAQRGRFLKCPLEPRGGVEEQEPQRQLTFQSAGCLPGSTLSSLKMLSQKPGNTACDCQASQAPLWARRWLSAAGHRPLTRFSALLSPDGGGGREHLKFRIVSLYLAPGFRAGPSALLGHLLCFPLSIPHNPVLPLCLTILN